MAMYLPVSLSVCFGHTGEPCRNWLNGLICRFGVCGPQELCWMGAHWRLLHIEMIYAVVAMWAVTTITLATCSDLC